MGAAATKEPRALLPGYPKPPLGQRYARGRTVNPTIYRAQGLARRIKRKEAFTTRVLPQPKLCALARLPIGQPVRALRLTRANAEKA